MSKKKQVVITSLIVIMCIAIFTIIYFVACLLNRKVYWYDWRYFRLINKVKDACDENFSYKEMVVWEEEDGTYGYAIILNDETGRGDEWSSKEVLQEIKNIEVAVEKFLADNPGYFKKDAKIEIRVWCSYVNLCLMNHMEDIVYDDFIQLMIATPSNNRDRYEIEDIATHFGNVKCLCLFEVVEDPLELAGFTNLETLFLNDSHVDEEVYKQIIKLYPHWEVGTGWKRK